MSEQKQERLTSEREAELRRQHALYANSEVVTLRSLSRDTGALLDELDRLRGITTPAGQLGPTWAAEMRFWHEKGIDLGYRPTEAVAGGIMDALNRFRMDLHKTQEDLQKKQAELDRLRAENEHLRAELTKANANLFKEKITSKPGATIECREVEIPEHVKVAISRSIQEGKSDRAVTDKEEQSNGQ